MIIQVFELHLVEILTEIFNSTFTWKPAFKLWDAAQPSLERRIQSLTLNTPL